MKKGATKAGPPPLLYACLFLTLILFISCCLFFSFLFKYTFLSHLKGVSHEIFSFWFFQKSVSTIALNTLYKTFQMFRKICEYI
jgi:hypothetical protein